MAIKCRIWWVTTMDAYAVVSGYNKDVVAALKTIIPSGDRDFDPNTKTWYVKEAYGEAIRKIAESAFGIGSVSFTSRAVSQQASQQFGQRAFGSAGPVIAQGQGTTEDALVAFMNLVPYEVAKRTYREASQTLHPDKPSGSHEKMAKLNELWQRVEKEFYKR